MLLVATMLVVDSRLLRDRAQRLEVTLDVVHHDRDALTADLVGLSCLDVHHEVRDTGTHVLVESRSSGQGNAPDQILRHFGVRPVSVSKYCVGVAALHPELPSNPWHRTLRRYFGPLQVGPAAHSGLRMC